MTDWVSDISTSLIAADMTDAVNDGVVSYDELLKLFDDLVAALKQTGGTLTAAEFSDLQIIAANLNNGVSTSDYLVSITRALVNGNLANAYWTGGASSSVALGNLAAGSSATQLDELVGKWFRGTDLPATNALLGASIYSTFTEPLFGLNGPVINDINEGYLGDCYFLACLAEVASQHPDAIVSMFTDNGNGTYGVRFYIDGAATFVTVDNQFIGGSVFPLFNNALYAQAFPGEWNIWVNLAEKAFAQLQATTATSVVSGGNPQGPGNTWEAIYGGVALNALAEITGASVIVSLGGRSGLWYGTAYDFSLGAPGASELIAAPIHTENLGAMLVRVLAAGNDIVLASGVDGYDVSSGLQTLVAGHQFSIYGYDAATGMFEVRNPWGYNAYTPSYVETFEISLDTLLALPGTTITFDNANCGWAPLLALQTSIQSWAVGQTVNFTLAANTFIELEGQTLTYTATLADGSALPSWLKFDPATGTFTGTVASTATNFGIKVTATDSEGLSTFESFDVNVPSLKLATQTPTQYWTQAVNFTLPDNTFDDSANQRLAFTATLTDGSALPSWLKFDPATGTFTGTPPDTPSALDVKVTATNVSGLSASETFSVYALAGATVTIGAVGNDAINFSETSGNNIADSGHGGQDSIFGGNGNNILICGPGNYLLGGSGNNILDGGGSLYAGGTGNYEFIIRQNTFASLIQDGWGGKDTVLFKDINPEDVSVQWSSDGRDAVFRLNATGAELTIQYQYSSALPYHIEQFVFADGTVWDHSQLTYAASTFTWVGSPSSPILTGNELGTNIFQPGAGQEVVNGGERSNFYQVSAGTGQVEIKMSAGASSKNELDFMAGITDENLWFEQSGNDLKIDVLGTNTTVTVSGWFSGSSSTLQEITAGGLKIDNQIAQLVHAMATYSASTPGFDPASSGAHTIPINSALQSTLAAAWH